MKKDETLGIVVGAAAIVGAFLWARKHTKGAAGVGYLDTPNYSLSLLNRYLDCVPVTDVSVCLNDTNKQGYPYVLCGDAQGGRDFYLAPKNLPYFRDYCKKHSIEYEEFYLPEDALSGVGNWNAILYHYAKGLPYTKGFVVESSYRRIDPKTGKRKYMQYPYVFRDIKNAAKFAEKQAIEEFKDQDVNLRYEDWGSPTIIVDSNKFWESLATFGIYPYLGDPIEYSD